MFFGEFCRLPIFSLPPGGKVAPKGPDEGAVEFLQGDSAVCGRRVTLPTAARRHKVRMSPFPPGGENCDRSLAPPLQRKPAALGFALGAAFGGLFGWKIAAGAVPLLRLALPNQRSGAVSRRRGGPMWPPASLPPSRGPIPSVRGKWPKAKGGRDRCPRRGRMRVTTGNCPALL